MCFQLILQLLQSIQFKFNHQLIQMSAEEFKLRRLIEDATFFIKNAVEDETYHEKSKNCLDEADNVILENTRQSYTDISAETILLLAEVALLSGKRDESAERILMIFFQRITQEDQFFCRALLARATIEERKIGKKDLKGEANLKQVLFAFSFVQKAIEISTRAENKQKYQFIVYNASIKTWHILRGMMRPGWQKFIVEVLEKISNLLEEADDSDFNWRCRYMNALCKSLSDAEKKPESLKILDKVIELTKKKGECNFQEILFRTRLHMYRDNNAMLANIKKESETGEDINGYKPLYMIQFIKSGMVPEPQIEKELQILMSSISPASISDDPAVAQKSSKITPIMQDRIAECGRIAIKYNLIAYAEGACNTVARARQGSLRAKVWTEYTKAELLLKKPSTDIDPKTGMKLNTLQKQIEDFERRIEALKILDRAMIANKRLQDAEVTIEGCILIWNIGIPFLKNSARSHIYKPYQAAAQALEQLEANETQLRVCLLLELAKYEIEQDFLSKASIQLKKALMIDYSTVQKSLNIEMTADDNPDDFARPYDRALKFLLKKLNLKTNLYGGEPDSVTDQIILDVENAKTTKNQKMRQTLLDKAIKQLQEFEEPEFEVKLEDNLVEEEIEFQKKKFHLQQVREHKERVLICSEIGKLALEENIIDLCFESSTLCVKEHWDPIKDTDLVIAQGSAHINLSKCYVEYLLEEDIEIGTAQLVSIDVEETEERQFTQEEKIKFEDLKSLFLDHIIKAVQLGQQSKQSWLVFNASIELWNNYLPVFKMLGFCEKIHPKGQKAMLESFEAMNNCFLSANFSPEHVDYELNKKMLVFSNMSVLLARLFEFKANNAEVVRICDILLQKQLPSHLRKTFDSIKARVTKSVSSVGATAAKKDATAAKGKGAVEIKEQVGPSKTDILTSEVLSYLELIANGQKDLIQKALDAMNQWHPNEQEEIELELNVELWCRLGRLAISQKTNAMQKVALYCADVAIKNGDEKARKRKFSQIPVTRLRWYAVAEALFGEALYMLLDRQKQEKESQDKLLHASVARFVESCHIASKAGIAYLVLESAKSMWNAIIGILDAPNNRKMLIKPMSDVHSYLLKVSENSDPDFLTLFYSALFQCIAEQKDWKLGEKITDEAFQYIPQSHQKVLWEAKMNFLSKLGKNVLSAISNMKESNASLMAKVWVRLARSSNNMLEQHSAYNKAIEILRKEESIEVVEVLIEYGEWMHRHKYAAQDVEDQLLLAVDMMMDIEPGWDDEDDEINEGNANDDAKTKKTGKSGSSRHSKAQSKAPTRKSIAKKSVAGKSKISKATMRTKSIRSKTSKNSKKTTTALQRRQEEDGQPAYLNCSHFDKLIRIHSMLAMLAPDASKQKEYALDAHFFIMKMWEQSFAALNAIHFMEGHEQELSELGFNSADQASRRDYFTEIFTGVDMQIPQEFTMPEKPDDWVSFDLPAKFFNYTESHEDKIMIAKYTFVKPELTFVHLKRIADLLDQHFFTLQLVPVLRLIELFCSDVIIDPIQKQTASLSRARILFNLGLKDVGQALVDKIDQTKYVLTEDDRRINYEKIKALRDPKDDASSNIQNLPFEEELAEEPSVIESIRIHESWLELAVELLRWGDFTRAKTLVQESNLHARILKDQDSFAKSLLVLSQIQYLEGDSVGSLRTAMTCQKYAKDLVIVEESIVKTFDLLFQFDKLEDCERLIDPSITMLTELRKFRKKEQQVVIKTQSKSQATASQVNDEFNPILPLEFALATTIILKAILNLQQSQDSKLGRAESDELMALSFQWAERFQEQITSIGYKQQHIQLMLRYTKMLWQIILNIVIKDMESVNLAKSCLTQCTVFLLKTQEHLTNQVYYIGVHQDSAIQSSLSLPLLRLFGICKLRIAQVNTTIGIVKNTMKTGSASSVDEQKKMAKIVQTFLDAVTKQIDASSNTYKKTMNRYEKSISILYSALNLMHAHCSEYTEIVVEIAKNRRLLAVNKKHLRGQWRQDAQIVEQVNMNIISAQAGFDRKDQLEAYGLLGEVQDKLIDYKQEMIKSFVEILDEKSGTSDDATKTTFERMVKQVDSQDNVLGSFAVEFAEARANLNKEQAFFYLAMYQYSVSRRQLFDLYQKSMHEQHPDLRRRRALHAIKSGFSQYTSPHLPKQFSENQKELEIESKPMQILSDFSTIEQLKEGLPGSSGYLLLQVSKDSQSMYVGYCQIQKDRKFSYFVDKLSLTVEKREQLYAMVKDLAQLKLSMMKTPITIQEDLVALEDYSEREISELLQRMEKFFTPITAMINKFINPEVENIQEVDNASLQKGSVGSKKVEDPKAKQPPAKQAAAPAKGAPVKGQEAQLAAYESILPLTTGGIESLVVIVDHCFETLPIESLAVFKSVPVVSRDFNLHVHMNRLKSVNHKAELHNNTGINKEELKYIIDLPNTQKVQESGTKFVKEQLPKLLLTAKIDGILTHATHIPSEGEWQQQISSSSMFAYYSMTCLLHKFPSSLLTNLSIFNKCKAMIILDRMNTFKTLVDRNVLTSKHFSPDDQPMQQAALFTLSGVASILINHWSVKPEDNLKQLQQIMKGSLQEGIYFGTGSLRQQEKRQLELTLIKREQSQENPSRLATAKSGATKVSQANIKEAAKTEEEVPDADYFRNSFRTNIVNIGVPFLRVV